MVAVRKKFLLRISESLWEDLQRWAGDELRSVNGQIEYLLQQAVNERRGSAGGPAASKPEDEPEDP